VVAGSEYFDAPISWYMPHKDFCGHASRQTPVSTNVSLKQNIVIALASFIARNLLFKISLSVDILLI
jgi:hypothetical protein